MRSILEPRISCVDGFWISTCVCAKVNKYSSKSNAITMLERGSCRHCKKDYRNVKDQFTDIYKNNFGKWCSICSGCNVEQAYTRKDHAKQSSVADWQCKKCVQSLKKFSNNQHIGAMERYYNRFEKSAFNRQIDWKLSLEHISEIFDGFCSLTKWKISLSYTDATASLDRIDSGRGYETGNVRWVHKMVNMCKNKYSETDFINMCLAIASNAQHDQNG